MYRILARTYQAVDGIMLARLPRGLQRRLKSLALRIGQRLFPHKLQGRSVETLMSQDGLLPEWKEPSLPEWVKEEMTALAAEIDPSLHPLTERAADIKYYSIPYAYDHPGAAYAELRGQWPEAADTVIVVPWLKPGGADLGALHFARALQRDFGRKVLVLATEPQDSPWAGRLPEGCHFLDAGRLLQACAAQEQQMVLARLFVQTAPHTIHVMNSLLGWQVVQRYGKALRQSSRLYASLYCDDVTVHGYRDGYAQRFLMECAGQLDAVVTDNRRNYLEWVGEMGVAESLFHVVPFPAPAGRESTGGAPTGEPAVLWAGRLDRQKRPDLLARIAAAMPEVRFDVYGTSVIRAESADLGELKRLPNVRLQGRYDDFGAIVRPDHAAFVYTTAWDGMPNILLEAARASLPVVAPDVGGIRDFLDESWLVADPEDVSDYVARLRSLVTDLQARRERIRAQCQLLDEQRGWKQFLQSVEGIPDYLAERVSGAR